MTQGQRHRRLRIREMVLCAAVFMMSLPALAEWKEKVLYSFQGGTSDGAFPAGGVVFDSQGNLYGALEAYGPGSCAPMGNYCGAVFQLAPPVQKGGAWTETLVYKFQGKGANDGEFPNGAPIIDSQGNLYGVTAYGGTGDCILLGVPAGCGTVYEISPPKQKGGKWKETILYSFPTSKQGYFPNGNLVFDPAGNLYGATAFGGTKGTNCDPFYGGQCGVLFELSPPKTKGGKWTERVVHAFAGIETGKQLGDGASPNGGLALDQKGVVYGTTYIGGYNCPHNSNQGCGTVFKLAPPKRHDRAWTDRQIYLFKAGNDGGGPNGGLIFDKAGSLYGTTVGGGAGNSPWGTVFGLVPSATGSWREHLLYTFQDGDDGAAPRGGLIIGPTGELFGTASGGGGPDFAGTLFRLKKVPAGGWAFAVLYSFTGVNNGDGAFPAGDIVLRAGDIFGTTQVGGTGSSCQGGCGTVFEAIP